MLIQGFGAIIGKKTFDIYDAYIHRYMEQDSVLTSARMGMVPGKFYKISAMRPLYSATFNV